MYTASEIFSFSTALMVEKDMSTNSSGGNGGDNDDGSDSVDVLVSFFEDTLDVENSAALKQLARLSLQGLITIFSEYKVDLTVAKAFSAAIGKKVIYNFYTTSNPMRLVNRTKLDLVMFDIFEFIKAVEENVSSASTSKRLVSVAERSISLNSSSSQSAFVAYDSMMERLDDLENAFREQHDTLVAVLDMNLKMGSMAEELTSMKTLLTKKCVCLVSNPEELPSSPTRKMSIRTESYMQKSCMNFASKGMNFADFVRRNTNHNVIKGTGRDDGQLALTFEKTVYFCVSGFHSSVTNDQVKNLVAGKVVKVHDVSLIEIIFNNYKTHKMFKVAVGLLTGIRIILSGVFFCHVLTKNQNSKV